MKTKIETIFGSNLEEFNKSLQRGIDAIEVNINNTVVDIKYSISIDGYSALIIYKVKDNERQILTESNGLDNIVSVEE